MLQPMPLPSATYKPSPAAPSFSSFLAGLAAPRQQPARSWDDALEDDVATLSYERALRAQARYRSADSEAWLPPQAPASSSPGSEADSSSAAAATVPPAGAGHSPGDFCTGSPSADALEPSRKRASITIRVSRQECAQLQQRAAEAGLTVSAYLRSCTLEVEALRTQVKQALAELRSAPAQKPPAGGAFRLRILKLLRFWQR
jgi:hypothetical protein